jgi:hypothetical protein
MTPLEDISVMSQVNPYASPISTGVIPPPIIPSGAGIYRSANVLVMEKTATLPDRCVKTNEPANGRRLKRSLSWHHPAVFAVVLLNVIIYAIVAMVVRKTAVIYIGVSEETLAHRRKMMVIGWVIVLLGFGVFIVGLTSIDPGETDALFGFFFFIAAIIAGLVCMSKARLVTPERITDRYVWLKGVTPEYLADFPDWQGGTG